MSVGQIRNGVAKLGPAGGDESDEIGRIGPFEFPQGRRGSRECRPDLAQRGELDAGHQPAISAMTTGCGKRSDYSDLEYFEPWSRITHTGCGADVYTAFHHYRDAGACDGNGVLTPPQMIQPVRLAEYSPGQCPGLAQWVCSPAVIGSGSRFSGRGRGQVANSVYTQGGL